MRLYLVRHGQSAWNLERRLQGQSPAVPLTDLGRTQATQAALQLAGLGLKGNPIWASDLLRASDTAAIIASVLESRVCLDQRLREQSYGELEGRLTSELRPEPIPEGLDITEVCWGGGESIVQVYARVRSFLTDLPNVETAVLVSHGDTLRVALTVIDQLNRGEPDERPHRLVDWTVVANGCVISRELKRG